MDNEVLEIYLRHILDAVGRIEHYIARVRKEDFFADDSMVAAAVVRELEIIGEAVSQVPSEYRSQYTSVPWREITDMRNRLIHGYFSVDYEIVWKTVAEDLSVLKQQILAMLKDLQK
ncbi:DUF86 domain-containing protein [Candidatus Gottesmanbacteria bacterium]|nr:DUF86 domain-containing protein [Candidatus Gottesmanbacteria bacterium]